MGVTHNLKTIAGINMQHYHELLGRKSTSPFIWCIKRARDLMVQRDLLK